MTKKREVKGDPVFHQVAFRDFVEYELAVGGPDPHMKVAAWIAYQRAPDDLWRRAWYAACYIAPYNVPTGEVIFHHWPQPSSVLAHPAAVEQWVHENWKRLTLRKERRAILAPHRFTEHFLDVARFVQEELPRLVAAGPDLETAYESVSQVRFNGRYGTMKFYETLRRMGVSLPEWTDIRPKGGWSPRLALSWLRPSLAKMLNGNDSPYNCAVSQGLASRVRTELQFAGLPLSWFDFEVMLCDYKQAYDGRQYPGRAHDSQLGHLHKVQKAGLLDDFSSLVLAARRKLFPSVALGELQGWDGRRDECSQVLRAHGYTWSDLRYDYLKTRERGDFSRPVRRDT